MFAVWEPMLPTDWGKPGASVLRRLPAPSVRQFWDAGHAVAGAIKRAEAEGKLRPHCCDRKGVLWDVAAVYGPGERWGKTLPEPILLDGPVVEAAPQLDAIAGRAK